MAEAACAWRAAAAAGGRRLLSTEKVLTWTRGQKQLQVATSITSGSSAGATKSGSGGAEGGAASGGGSSGPSTGPGSSSAGGSPGPSASASSGSVPIKRATLDARLSKVAVQVGAAAGWLGGCGRGVTSQPDACATQVA
jgi:hypothetical protein